MKKNKFLTILLVLLLSLTLVIGLVACDNNTEDEGEQKDNGKIISNGNFELTTVGDYPRVPSNWSALPGSSSSDNATLVDEDALIRGVINTDSSIYKSSSKEWDKLNNPGKTGSDNNILMIYNKKMTSYQYKSSSMSLSANKHYKLTLNVLTDKITGAGAFVTISGSARRQFTIGNTNGTWQTYEFFFETSNVSSNSVNITLSNGLNGKNDGKLSQGYTFFDNIVVTELEKNDNGTAKEQFDAAVADSDTAKVSMLIGDTDMSNYTGISNTYTPVGYKGVTSTGTEGSAPTGADSLEKGIINTNETLPDFLPSGFAAPANSNGNILFINNIKKTAYSYMNESKLRFTAGKYYKLTIDLNTYLGEGNASNTGAHVRLMSSNSKEETLADALVSNIDTSNNWETVTFYVKADTLKTKDLYLQIDLGTGGKNENSTLVIGKLFVDNFKLALSTQTEYEGATKDTMSAIVNLNTTNIDDNADNQLFDARTLSEQGESSMWGKDDIAYQSYSSSDLGSAYFGSLLYGNTGAWNTDVLGFNPGSYVNNNTSGEVVPSDVIMISNKQAAVTHYSIYNDNTSDTTAKYFGITSNKYYRIGAWVKTADIIETLGLNIALMSYDSKTQSGTMTESQRHSTLQTISNFNTDKALEGDTTNFANNDYTELVFYVEGDLLEEKSIYLRFSLGDGSFFDVSKHVKGSAYISGLTMFEVDYSDYTSETGTYVKKHSFKSDQSSIGNGNFDKINNQTTLSLYTKDDETEDNKFKLDYTNGYLNNAFGVPSDWKHSDEATLKNHMNAGVLNLNATDLQDMLNLPVGVTAAELFSNNFFNGFNFGNGILDKAKNPNVLVINTKKGSESTKFTEATSPKSCGCVFQTCLDQNYCDGIACVGKSECRHHNFSGEVSPFGFTSPDLSLSANTYYKISVWVKIVDGEASITLTTKNKEDDRTLVISDTNGEWSRYDFYIETGFEATTANVGLFLGNKTDNYDTSGTVFFDLPQLVTITEDSYTQAIESADDSKAISTLSYTVNSFDNTTITEDGLDTAAGWTGSHADSEAPSKENNVTSGVYNYDHGDRDWLGKGGTPISSQVMDSILSPANPNALVINNNVKTEYMYTYTLSKSLSSKSYYKISIKVLTYNLSADEHATISLNLENLTYSFSKNADKKVLVNTNANGALGWAEYTYYIQTPNSTSVSNSTITLSLGSTDNYMQGYAFFDDLTIAKINEDQFNEGAPVEGENETPTFDESNTMRIVFTDDDATADPSVPPEETDPLLWLYISSIVLGGLVVLVALIYVGKFIYNKSIKPRMNNRKKANKTAQYDRKRLDSNADSKSNRNNDSDKHKD